jgi:hypothetical protein
MTTKVVMNFHNITIQHNVILQFYGMTTMGKCYPYLRVSRRLEPI